MGFLGFFQSPKSAASPTPQDSPFSDVWLSRIIAELGDAIVAYDEEFRVLIFNAAAERIFVVSATDVMGQKLTLDRASEPKLKLLIQTIFPSLAPSMVARSEPGAFPQVVDLHFDDLHLRVTTHRIVAPDGELLGFVKVARDRSREDEILRSKSDFLTVAAHQLRTPLAAVNWAFEGVAKESLSEAGREMATTGTLAAKKLLKIVDDLLDVAKLEGGKYGYAFQQGDFIQFLDRLLSDAQTVATSYNVHIYFDHAGLTTLPLTFDAQKLGLALSNVIDNAVKYNVPNGSVTLTLALRVDAPFVDVRISDTGVGIPPEALHKLFTKFFRADNVMRFATEGSGLGLYLAKNIILRHGGKISVQSQLNRGTTFFVVLPTDPKLIPQKEIMIEE